MTVKDGLEETPKVPEYLRGAIRAGATRCSIGSLLALKLGSRTRAFSIPGRPPTLGGGRLWDSPGESRDRRDWLS